MITLIGHGYIGTHIAKKLRDFEWISHKELPNEKTQFIVNAAGYIGYPNVDACEVNKELCMEANVLYPLRLEQKYKVPILHITSGCVYTGYPQNGWRETDEPNFNFDNGSFYSGCKILFQKMLKEYLNKSYLFRIRLPFDDTLHQKNLLYKYEKYSTLVNFENSITCVEDLVNCVSLFIKERPEYGIYNIVNKKTTTTKQIVEKMQLNKEWMSHDEFQSKVNTPRSNCSLNTEKIESVYDMPCIESALDKTIYSYRKNNL
jgi:UDP-glucose 4,6-dehydratase